MCQNCAPLGKSSFVRKCSAEFCSSCHHGICHRPRLNKLMPAVAQLTPGAFSQATNENRRPRMALRVIEIEVYYLTLFRESWFETRDAFFEAPYICAILWQGCDAFVQEYTRILHYGLHPRSRFVHSLIKEGWDGASFGAWSLSKSQVRTLWWFPLLCNDFHGLVSHVQAFCEQFFY